MGGSRKTRGEYASSIIGGEVDDDSLENALEAIERRQRDLQMRENFGQPENIGYGFQKNLGFFDSAPARHLGASREPDDLDFASFSDGLADKRSHSNFRERGNSQDDNLEYLQSLRGLWERNQHQRVPARAVNFEDLSDQDVAEILGSMKDDEDRRHNYQIPDNYRIPENYPKKPTYGDEFNEKRNAQRLTHEQPPGDAFLYSLKWVNPAMNREGVEALRGAEPFNDDRDSDVAALLSQPRYKEKETWLRGPVKLDDLDYGDGPRNMRRSYHGYMRKRSPVKRNANHSQKQTNDEVKGIFGSDKKKPISEETKKPLTAKGKDVEKKVVRRAEPQRPGEITDLFRVQKKDIDWHKHFGVNKRMYANPFDTRVFNTNQHHKRNRGDDLEAVENRISGVEDKLLEDAIKLTGAHGDEGLDKIRAGVLRRIEAAYNLEKMRSSLEEFKNSVNSGVTDSPISSTTAGKSDGDVSADGEKDKRVAMKKESVVDPDVLEFLNWQRGGTLSEECPLLDQLVDNCVQMEENLGKFTDMLTPGCTLHQICFTCGPELGFSEQNMCDLMFLSEAEHLCAGKPECLSGARDTVLALRETHARSPPIGSCRANPCIADFFVSSPSGVVYLPMA